jgi:hypothetical protein
MQKIKEGAENNSSREMINEPFLDDASEEENSTSS